MTVGALGVLSILVLPLVIGGLLLHAMGLRWQHDRLAFGAWACVAGCLAIAAALFAGLAAALPLAAAFWVPALLVASLLVFRARRRAPTEPIEPTRTTGPRLERLGFHLVLLACLLRALYEALLGDLRLSIDGDEAIIWASKAWTLFEAGNLRGPLVHPLYSVWASHVDYPLLDPLLQVWAMVHAGGLAFIENRLPMQLCFLALVLLTAASLRRVVRPGLAALLLVLVFTCTPVWELPRFLLADHLVALGLLALVDAWMRWSARPAAAWWRLAMVSAAFMVWSKNEGLALLVLSLLALPVVRLVRRRLGAPRGARRPSLAWIGVPLAVVLGQQAFNRFHGYANDIMVAHDDPPWVRLIELFPERIGPVSAAFADALLLQPASTQWLFALLVALLLVGGRRVASSPGLGPSLVVVGAVASLGLIYIITPKDLQWHLDTSLVRVLYQFVPAAAVCAGAALAALDPRAAPPADARMAT